MSFTLLFSHPTTRVKLQEGKQYIQVNVVIVGIILTDKAMMALLTCNHQQFQDISTQTIVNENKIASDN